MPLQAERRMRAGAWLWPATLTPKLAPPVARKGQQIEREALLDRIEQAGRARLVLVCAPAGFGKTTVLQQCRERFAAQTLATGWLTLDAQDNDCSRFLTGLQAALHGLVGTDAPADTASRPASIGEWALQLIDRVASLLTPFALFLDDLETVQDPGVLSLLGELVERLPRHGRLVMASRRRPALALARLRARGELLEIDTEHLRFSLRETTCFFAAGSVRLSPELLHRLHDKSEGWIAALSLALLALDRPQASTALIERFCGSHLALADYLAEEVLAGLAQDTREFLLCTSVLKQLHPAICQALLPPHMDAAAMLERVAAANLFLTPVLDAPDTYRYHALFAGFLRAQLAREQPQRMQALHRAAAGWFQTQQRPVPAIDHAMEGGDQERALRLLDAHAMPLLTQGRLRLLARWLGKLPPPALAAHPRLHTISLWAQCLTAGPAQAMARLDVSSLRACNDPVVRRLVEALAPTLLAMLDRQDEAYACGLPLLSGLSGDGAFADLMLVNVMANAATVLGRHQQARQLLDAGRQAQGRTPSAFGLMYAESVDGIIDLLEGRLRQAHARFHLAVQPGGTRAASPSALPHACGNAWAGLLYAATVYESGALDHAHQLLQVYLPMACDAGVPDHMILGHIMLARIARSRHDPDQALQLLAELESLGHRRGLARVVAGARLERARMALMQGDPTAFETELDRAADPPLWQRVARECHLANDLENPTLSRLRHAVLLGDAEAALPAIEREIAVATATSCHRRVLLLRLLEAMATLRRGETAIALSQFTLVLKVCTREGFVRLVVDEGPLAGELLQRWLARNGDERQREPMLIKHAHRLLQAFGPLPEPVQPEPISERLTPQELRVLQSVAEGLSNDAVGQRWGISRSTVRTHLRNISVKLGAQNRTQAVGIARRMGLLD